jgi:prepilin peptidase CpaA
LLLPFYAAGVLGAGDVKLLGAVGAVVGPQVLISVALYGAIVGGGMSAFVLVRRGRLFTTLSEALVRHRPPARSGATAPYGVAIALGVLLSIVLPGVMG